MKLKKEHIVPLSRQAIDVLYAIRELDLGDGLVFPTRSGSKRVISENTLNHALHRMGYKERQTQHGLRTVASTILNKGDSKNKWNKDAIERQLAHSTKSDNAMRDAYNRYEFLEERAEMMQWYADQLDMLAVEDSRKVVPLRRQA